MIFGKANYMIFRVENFRFPDAQISSEYAILVSVIIAVLMGMNIYIKRGFQARYRDVLNYTLSSPLFNTSQYEPPYSYSTTESIEISNLQEKNKNSLKDGLETDYEGTMTIQEHGLVNITNETKHRKL